MKNSKKREIISLNPIVVYGFALVLLLPLSFLLITFLFHDSVDLDKPKFVEETAKLVASFMVSIISLLISNVNEYLKSVRKSRALKAILAKKLSTFSKYIDTVIKSINQASMNNISENSIAQTREYIHIKENLEDSLSYINIMIFESKAFIVNAGVDIGVACSQYIEAFDKTNVLINEFLENPSRQNSLYLKDTLEKLLQLPN